jgi:hypothetical protein
MAQALLWNQIEAQKAKTGIVPMQGGQSEGVYRAWIRDCDARKAQALLIVEDKNKPIIDDLLKIRALLFRGELQAADAFIRDYSLKNGASDEAVFEASLEQARLAAFQGDWVQAHALTAKGLESGKLESLSYLSSLQVHALSCFELGSFSDALKSLEMADALSSIYPFSVSSFYVKTLLGRVIARTQGVEHGLNWLDQIWSRFRENDSGAVSNSDSVHALVFALIDILKYAKVSTDPSFHAGQKKLLESLTLASFALTEATGERLYSALASADAAACGSEQNQGWFLKKIQSERGEFRRIEKLMSAYESSQPSGASEAVFAALMQARSAAVGDEAPTLPSHLFFSKPKWVFQLKPWSAVDLDTHPQLVLALNALSKGPLTKEAFFNEVWGNARYTSRLHASSIQYVLSRIKKITGIRCRQKDGLIVVDHGWLAL